MRAILLFLILALTFGGVLTTIPKWTAKPAIKIAKVVLISILASAFAMGVLALIVICF